MLRRYPPSLWVTGTLPILWVDTILALSLLQSTKFWALALLGCQRSETERETERDRVIVWGCERISLPCPCTGDLSCRIFLQAILTAAGAILQPSPTLLLWFLLDIFRFLRFRSESSGSFCAQINFEQELPNYFL